MASLKKQIEEWGLTSLVKGGSAIVSSDVRTDLVNDLPINSDKEILSSAVKTKSDSYYSIKSQLHRSLLNEVDLVAAESMPSDLLKIQLQDLIEKIIINESVQLNDHERQQLIAELQNEILGLGPLEPLLADHEISEIMVNNYDEVYVEKGGKIEPVNTRFNDNQHLLKIIDKIVSYVGRRIDESSPMVDARLPDGSRVNAIIPPLAINGPALSIRRFSVTPLMMSDLIAKNALTESMAELFAGFVKAKVNILISGGTGSGKTTLLNILSGYIPSAERIITIEDTAELQLQQDHVIRLETRPPNIEGRGEITMRALVKNSLRMRPDRIVLGEVRGEEVIDMLQAMNTGHDGSLTTIHANNPRDALSRLENLIGMGSVNLPSKALRQQISSAIQVIIQVSRLNDGSRKVMSVHEITGMEGDVITSQEIFYFDRQGMDGEGNVIGHFKATGVRPVLADRLKGFGIDLHENLFNPNQLSI